ncbi:hypothetical protein GZL_01628 [Streptomyces sp. 769]|nr:hypothetical protein GZL_01628 [Streptomyces sp. 769]
MILGFALSRAVGLSAYQEEGWGPPYGILSMVAEVVFIGAFFTWYGAGKAHTPAASVTRPTPPVHVR